MYQNIRANHNIDYFTHDKNVSIKRDGKYAIRFVSIFHLSVSALNYLRTVLTVIISQVAQVCLEKGLVCT